MYTSLIIYTTLLIAGVFTWKKYNDRRYYWYLYPIGGALLVSIADHFSKTQLTLTQNQNDILFYLLMLLRAIALVSIVVITFNKSFNNHQ